jgi:dienelactone hydrolase
MKPWLKRRWWVILLGLILVIAVSFAAWGLIIPSPMPEALSAMQSDSQVSVSSEHWLVFEPVESNPGIGLIFYPGGRVDPRAYAPMAHRIAAHGYLVIIVPMPLNLAVFGVNRAAGVIQSFPKIEHWVIGGHSLGGAMAAAYADKHDSLVDGLVLLASYPANSNSLQDDLLKVVSIYATRDGLATQDKIDASQSLLPPGTTWVRVVGGNHAQFGWYGNQPGDLTATISREEQQEQVSQAILVFLGELK